MTQTTQLNLTPQTILVFGAADILMQAIVRQLNCLLPSTSRLIVVGNQQDIGLTNLVRMEKRSGAIAEILQNDQFSGHGLELLLSAQSNAATLMALDHLERKSASFVWRHHELNSIMDEKHYYRIITDLIAHYLTQQRIDLILFFELPHLFVDTLAYQIAKSRQINTLMLSPTIYPEYFFSLRDINDYGKWSPTPTLQDDHRFAELTETLEWDYMKGTEQQQGKLGKLNGLGILMLLVHLLTVRPATLLQPFHLANFLRRMSRIASLLPKWRYPFSRYFDIRHLDYFETLLQFETTEIDFHCKFVYFPLQLQPEMTTSTLGGIYADQILALEQLCQLLPDDCLIYLKENPKQGGCMRGAQFFHRLSHLSNIRWVPSYANTHQLIEHAQFVAAITGTAAWEAICNGKKALIFGSPWYLNLPGIFKYQDDLTYDRICDFKIDPEHLQQAVRQLFARAHGGRIQPLKRRRSGGKHDLEKNAKRVANTIVDLIQNRISTTFSS